MFDPYLSNTNIIPQSQAQSQIPSAPIQSSNTNYNNNNNQQNYYGNTSSPSPQPQMFNPNQQTNSNNFNGINNMFVNQPMASMAVHYGSALADQGKAYVAQNVFTSNLY